MERAAENAENHSYLKGKIYKRKTLNPRRLKGFAGFTTAFGIYSYFPYIAAYFGATAPVLVACASSFYGMFAFSEQ